MLLDGIVDLRHGERLDLQQFLKEVIHRLLPPVVLVEDGLRAPALRRGADTRLGTRRTLWTWHDRGG